MLNKIIIAALAFASTACGIRTNNEISMSTDAQVTCTAERKQCNRKSDASCCDGLYCNMIAGHYWSCHKFP